MSYTNKELIEAVKQSSSFSEVLRKLGLAVSGASHQNIKRKILDLKLDCKHFCKIHKNKFNKKHYNEVLVLRKNKTRETTHILRRAMIESGKKYKCENCGLCDIWNDKEIVLEIDHINGDYWDNRKDNLRFLCPNCHSQTPNFYHKKKKYYCLDCKTKISSSGSRCNKCASIFKGLNNRKVERPNKEELSKLVWQQPTTQIANHFGVSDKAVEKWCKSYGIEKPPRGYWAKKIKGV